MTFMNRYDGKFQSLLDALTDCDRRRSYYLSLATCYCTPQAVRCFIDAIQDRLKIAEIFLYLDRREAIKIGREQLTALEESYPGILSIYAVRAGRLFHTKGYCLTAYSDEDLVHGRLALGSANLTSPGLTDEHGNIESLAIFSDLPMISEFLEFFEDDGNRIELEDLTSFPEDSDDVDFMYALLTRGWFSHNWSATLAAYFSVRSRLNEEARQLARERIATPGGFEMDSASISKSYFGAEFRLQDRRLNDKNLVKKYGIECFLGHWIPKSVVDYRVERNERFEEFKTALFNSLDSKMDRIRGEIKEDYESLKTEEIIDELDVHPLQGFRERSGALREDDVQLGRIWSGRYFFEYPYDLGDVKAIEDTFNDIWATIRQKKRRNRAMHSVLEAWENRNLEPLENLPLAD